MGRPTKFDQQTADFIINMIERGIPRHRAARAAGISKSTLQAWIARGREEAEVDPEEHTKKELLAIAKTRGVKVAKSATKPDIAEAINEQRSPFSDFSDRVYRADSRFFAAAFGKMQDVGKDDWRMWKEAINLRFPETRSSNLDYEPLSDPDEDIGTESDAERALERAEEIRIKMLGTGTDG